MYFEMPSEEEKTKILERVARLIVDRNMEAAAIIFLETIKPISFMSTQLTLFTFMPFLMVLERELQEKAYVFIRLLEKEENVEQLLKMIETLSEEKKALNKRNRKSNKKFNDRVKKNLNKSLRFFKSLLKFRKD